MCIDSWVKRRDGVRLGEGILRDERSERRGLGGVAHLRTASDMDCAAALDTLSALLAESALLRISVGIASLSIS